MEVMQYSTNFPPFFLILIKSSFLRTIYLKPKESIYKFCKILIEHIFMSRTRSSTLWESKILSPTPVLKLFRCCFNHIYTSEYLFYASVSLSMKSSQIIVIFYYPYSKTYISNPGIYKIYLRILEKQIRLILGLS